MNTLVFGLDAADWDLIDPLLDEGRLPNLADLIEDGVSGDMRSTRPAMTPQAWTSMVTG
jgi:predicted AlkP superfamily phosphohydrolase/phosphomutase